MNRNIISQRVMDALGDLERLKYMLRAIDTLDIQRYPKNYETMSTDAALLSEKITCKLRSLIYASTTLKKLNYLTKAASAQEVQVSCQNGQLCVTLPRLLPRRGGKYSSLFLTEPVHAALDQFATEQPLPKFRDCTVCIVHEYDAAASDRLIFDFTTLKKLNYLTKAASAQEVQVSCQNGQLCVTLPRLLPRRGGKYSSLFLTEPVHAALDQFATEQPLPKFRDCTVCIVHEYDAAASDRLIFDFDNLQQKQLLDTIAVHVMTDDNALLCDVFCTAERGRQNRTKVFVMEKNRFSQWLSGREIDRRVISDFS